MTNTDFNYLDKAENNSSLEIETNTIDAKRDTIENSSSKPKNENKCEIKKYFPDQYFLVKFLICALVALIVIFISKHLVISGIIFFIIIEMLVDKIIVDIAGGLITSIAILIKLFKTIKKLEIIDESKLKGFFEYIKKQSRHNHIKKKIPVIYITFIIIISFIGFNIPYFHAFAYEKFEATIEFFDRNIESQSNDSSNDLSVQTYPDYITFVLDEYQSNNKTDDALLENVYAVTSFYGIWKYCNDIRGTETSDDNTNYFSINIQEDEDAFHKSIEEAKVYAETNGRNSEWYSMLPSEEMLLQVIEKEEEYSKTHKSFFVFNRISNLYQKLGLEYVNQGKDKNIAKYYYMKSIEYDLMCIKHSSKTLDYDYNKALERLYSRYQDIYNYCIEDYGSEEGKLLKSYIDEFDLHIKK